MKKSTYFNGIGFYLLSQVNLQKVVSYSEIAFQDRQDPLNSGMSVGPCEIGYIEEFPNKNPQKPYLFLLMLILVALIQLVFMSTSKI